MLPGHDDGALAREREVGEVGTGLQRLLGCADALGVDDRDACAVEPGVVDLVGSEGAPLAVAGLAAGPAWAPGPWAQALVVSISRPATRQAAWRSLR